MREFGKIPEREKGKETIIKQIVETQIIENCKTKE